MTGKGGVGKSTVSLALGLAAAARGKRTIVCEVSSQENASRLFKKGEVGFNEVEVADNLWAISIDPDESLREYLLLQLKVRAMRDLLVRSKLFNYLAAATPGLKELVTIGKIWELAQADRKVKKGSELRPRDRRRAGDRPRDRLPADAAHLRRHRPGRPDPLAGEGARPLHHRPRDNRRRDRLDARGDAGERVGLARRPAQPTRSGSRSTAST